MFNFFKKKSTKEKLTCLGVIDSKPYHYFEPGLIYAKDQKIAEGDGYKVYARIHKDCLFVFVLVDDETNFDLQLFTVAALEEEIRKVITDSYNQSVLLIIFKNSNDKTISIAKNVLTNTKKELNQILIFNAEKVRLDYYRPIPSFYKKIYDEYLEAIYFDLACIQHEDDR